MSNQFPVYLAPTPSASSSSSSDPTVASSQLATLLSVQLASKLSTAGGVLTGALDLAPTGGGSGWVDGVTGLDVLGGQSITLKVECCAGVAA